MISVDELPDRVRLQKLKVTVLKVREFCTVSQDSLRLPECSQVFFFLFAYDYLQKKFLPSLTSLPQKSNFKALENLLTAGMMRMISRYLHMVRFGK